MRPMRSIRPLAPVLGALALLVTPAGASAQGAPARASATAPAPLAVGAKARVSWSGGWYDATVLEVREGQYRIHYDGWSSDWDEWVDPSRLRRADGGAVAAPVVIARRREAPAPVETPKPVEPDPPPKVEPAPRPPPKGPFGLANMWTYQTLTFRNADGSMTDASGDVGGSITFFPNGQFRQSLRIGDFTNETHGTYRVRGNRVTTKYDWNGPQSDELTFGITGDRLSLTLGSGRPGERTTYYGLQLSGSCDERGRCAAVPIRR